MLLGTDIQAVLTTLRALDVDVIGLNCSTGPEDMRDAIRFLGETSPLPVHCIPNAGLPLQGPDGETIFPEEPEPLAATLGEFVERYGVGIVGGCCGTTPEHIAAIRERVEGRAPGERPAPGPIEVSSMMTSTALVQEPRPTLVGERVNSQGSRKAKELLLADDYDGLVQVAEDQVEGGAHVLDVCVALTERHDEDEQMSAVVKRISLTQPAPIQVDSTEPRGDQGGAGADPRAGDRQLDQPRGRPRQGRRRRAAGQGARGGADRADDRRGRDGEDGRAQGRDRRTPARHRLRRARPRSRGADLRRAHLHPDHRRRGVAALGGRDDRGDPPDQGGDPRRQDLARRLQRLLRRLAAAARRPQLGLPAPLRRGRARPGDGQPQPHHPLRRDPRRGARADRRPRLQPPRGRAGALHRPLRVQGRGGRERGRRPDRRDGARAGAALAHPAPQEGRRRGLDRPLGGEDRRRPDPERGAAAGDEGGRRQVRRRRADPALRPAVGRSDEARRGAAGELPRPDRRPHQGQGGDRHRLRRRPRHRQVAGQHDPDQQRLHRDRPRQAGPGRRDHRGRGRKRGRRDRPLGAARLDLEADADLRPGAAPARARLPGADRRRRDQPRLRPPHPLPEGQGVRRGLRARRLLLQGRLPGARHDGRPGRRGGTRAPWSSGSGPRRSSCARSRWSSTTRRRSPTPASAPPSRTDNPVPAPPFWGAREIAVDLDDVFPYLDRHVLFKLHWGGKGVKGEAWRELVEGSAEEEGFAPRLERMWREQDYLRPRARLGYFPCNADGNELVDLRPGESRARARAPRLPAPAQARPHLPRRLLPAAGERRARRRRAAGRHRRPRGDRADRATGARRRVRRAALRARPRRPVGRGPGRVAALRRPPRARHRPRPGPPLLLGLPGLPGPVRAREGLAPARPRSRSG